MRKSIAMAALLIYVVVAGAASGVLLAQQIQQHRMDPLHRFVAACQQAHGEVGVNTLHNSVIAISTPVCLFTKGTKVSTIKRSITGGKASWQSI